MFTRSMTMLNSTGDTTIAWTEDADEKMKAAIQAKIDKGYVFFITKPKNPEWMKRVKTAADIKNREVLVLDDDMAKIFEGFDVGATREKFEESVETQKISRDPEEISRATSMVIQPIRGG